MLADAVRRRAHLDDVDGTVGDISLDLDLIPQVLGDALTIPEVDAVEIGLGRRHHVSDGTEWKEQHVGPR